MKIKIHVTKEMYRRALYCGWENGNSVSHNCAIALAVREIAPEAQVTGMEIIWACYPSSWESSDLPPQASYMLGRFDATSPKHRLLLPEFTFEVDFPDALVEKIGIEEVKEILKKSETLELV